MKIVFTREAKAGLDELRDYLGPLNPLGLGNVVAAIERKILHVAEYPQSGRQSPRDDVREVIESRYGFLIPYYMRADVLYVLRIYRGSREPLDYQSLKTEA